MYCTPLLRRDGALRASPSNVVLHAPSQKRRRFSEALEGLTINKLRVSKLGLYGRYLSMLAEKMLLEYNLGMFKWIWDIKEIETQTLATDNAVDLLKAHLEDLPESVIHILKLCAFLDSTFKKETLILVWHSLLFKSGIFQNFVSDDALHEGLKSAEEEGLLEALDSSTTYKWIHDKIQEAAMSLFAENYRSDLGKQVGQSLVASLNENDLEASIFTMLNLLNEGDLPCLAAERIKLAELNLRATQKAALLSSFASSAKYAGKGIGLLAEDTWSKQYKLSLDLFFRSRPQPKQNVPLVTRSGQNRCAGSFWRSTGPFRTSSVRISY